VLAAVIPAKRTDPTELVRALDRLDEGFIVRPDGILDPLLDPEKARSPFGEFRFEKTEAEYVMGTEFHLSPPALESFAKTIASIAGRQKPSLGEAFREPPACPLGQKESRCSSLPFDQLDEHTSRR
jgi:hypothetical protein